MRVSVVFAHPGDDAGPEPEPPRHFATVIDRPFDRTPAVGEAIDFGDGFIAIVRGVLWRLEGNSEVHIEIHPGYESYQPSQRQLRLKRWWET